MPDYADALRPFEAEVQKAAARAFSAVREAHPGETFYAFAVYSGDDAMTVCPAANTEEAHAATVRRSAVTSPADIAGLRWNTGDWEYEFEGAAEFDRACNLLNALLATVPDDHYFEVRDQVYLAIVAALDALNREGYFGEGVDREKITVYFTITDSANTLAWERRSVAQLNPPAVAERFIAALPYEE